MPATVWGIVREGKVIPEKPLPEGAAVQILLADEATAVPPQLKQEFDAWAIANEAPPQTDEACFRVDGWKHTSSV